MFSIHNRDDLEKLKNLDKSQSTNKKRKIKEKKLGKQDFHFDMKEVFEPITNKQSKIQQTIY